MGFIIFVSVYSLIMEMYKIIFARNLIKYCNFCVPLWILQHDEIALGKLSGTPEKNSLLITLLNYLTKNGELKTV